jgi:DNA-binding NarL/FixJ family response regulator
MLGGQTVKPRCHASRPSIRILLADSNQTQAQLLSSALRRRPGLSVTCCRSELSNCLQALRSIEVDVVLVSDSPADHIHLIDTLRGLHASHPHIGLILLLDSYDRNLVVEALRAGARGLFCRASQQFQALCRCISVVHQGQFWASTEQIGYLIEALRLAPPTRVINAKGEGLLTPRENQVVSLVAEGIGNREIAQQLGVKENTVKKSLLRIYDKIGISNRVELVLYALTNRSTQTDAPNPAKIFPGSERLVSRSVEASRMKLLGTN